MGEKIIATREAWGVRHGDKTINEATRDGEQTLLGFMQNLSIFWQLISIIGIDGIRKAIKYTSPVWRVEQLTLLFVILCGLDPRISKTIQRKKNLEWGPGMPDHTNYLISLIRKSKDGTIIGFFGHDGNLQDLAQKLNPLPTGHNIGRGEGFYMEIVEFESGRLEARKFKKLVPKISKELLALAKSAHNVVS